MRHNGHMSSSTKPRQKSRRGRKARCSEPLVSLSCYLPGSVMTRLDEMAWELRVSRSDLMGWAALRTLNSVRREHGEDPIPVPEYLDKELISALYRDALPLDEDNEEPGENAGQEELVMTG